MIISIIKQLGLRLRADPEEIPFQYSSNIQMQFIKDENYNDYTVVGYYIPPGENEAKLLSINDDGTFILGPDCFKQRGTLSFSFNLINSIEEVHLGSIDFEVRYSFGDGDTILPEPEEVWISLVTQVAKDAIREEVALVKQKANEALQSASLANDKASEAEEYANNANQSANSASLSASSALTAKNDAIAASDSAIQAKQDAEQSANNAKNSANTALENANKSTEAVKTVNQIKTQIEDKANEFDTNYQEKLSLFNDNATEKQNAFNQSVTSANDLFDKKVVDANNDLDSKLQQANTIIDEKVKTATEQAQKATNEANRATQATDGKLDKNLGAENSDKILITDAKGNIITQNKEDFEGGGGTTNYNDLENKPSINGVELIGNKTSGDLKMYTKEEVDYLLDDKMDKPYVPIEITDNATITDALEGNFKIDKIKGNTYQNVETDIVPTPDRPVPINSRKVKVNSEYVELRSLKETGNLFDINFIKLWGNYSDGMTILDDGTVKVTNNDATLLPLKTKSITIPKSANYTIKYDFETISGGANSGWISLVNMSNDNPKIFSTSEKTLYLDAGDYYVRFYRGQGVTDVENNIVQYSNIVLVEGTSAPSTYVAPTVRDYKIVDHNNKTSKIIRNVGLYIDDKTGNKWMIYDSSVYTNSYMKQVKDMKVSNRALSFCNSLTTVNDGAGINNPNTMWLGVNGKFVYIIKTNYKSLDEWKAWLADNDFNFLYPLATPTEEAIDYSADDTSEVGYSWQDTTSPSPTIKSEVKGVEKIDILKTGKNLFDFSKIKENYGLTIDYENKTITIPPKTNNAGYVNNLKDLMGGYKIGEKYIMSAKTSNIEAQRIIYFLDIKNSIKFDEPFTLTEEMLNSPFAWYNNIESKNQNVISNIQIEQSDTPTSYEPYTEQRVNITPPQPLYSTLDRSIADEVDVEKGVYRYWLLKDKIENLATAVNNAQKHGNFQSYFITKVKDNSLKPITLLGNEDTRNLICNKCNVNLLDYNNEKETFSLYVDKSVVFVGNINIERLNENTTLNIYNFIKDFEIVYPLLTPIEIPIPQEDLKLLKSLKTEQGVTNIFVGGEVKPTIEARYPRDLALVQQQLEQKILLISDSLIDTQAKLLLQGGND